MHTVVRVDGELANCIIIPDADTGAVNLGGTHSTRGGQLAKKVYRETGPTADRLKYPMLRVNGELQPISWDIATNLVADLSTHVIDTYGELAWGMKIYSYQYYENVFAASKLALGSIGTPNYSPPPCTGRGR